MLDIISAIQNTKRPVLIISPHADDAELGCGGTIVKLTDAGILVYHLILSLRELASPSNLTPEQLAEEMYSANAILGIPKERIILHNLSIRTYPSQRQEILEMLIKTRKELNPALVIMPSFDDTHQDHMTVAHECFRAFKNSSLLTYQLIWNHRSATINGISILEEKHLQKKIQALKAYQCQALLREFFNEEYIKSLAISNGMMANVRYAEILEVLRLII